MVIRWEVRGKVGREEIGWFWGGFCWSFVIKIVGFLFCGSGMVLEECRWDGWFDERETMWILVDLGIFMLSV